MTKLSLSALKPKSWILLGLMVVLTGVGVWQSILPFLAERHFRDGFHYGVNNRLKYAIEELEKAIDLAPWESHYMIQLGKYYEDYARAQSLLENKLYLLRKAETLYDRILVLDRLNPWFYNRCAVVYEELAKLIPDQSSYYMTKAEQYTRTAAETDAQNPLFQLNYASFLHRASRFDEALRYYTLTKTLDDTIGESYYNSADVYRQKGDIQKAIAEYEALYKLDPNFPKIRLALASMYILYQRPADAIPLLEEETEKNDPEEKVLRSLGQLYFERESWANVKRIYGLALTHFPTQCRDLHPYYIQGIVNTSGIEDAIEELLYYLDLYPDDKIATLQLKQLQSYLKKGTP